MFLKFNKIFSGLTQKEVLRKTNVLKDVAVQAQMVFCLWIYAMIYIRLKKVANLFELCKKL